MPVIEVTSPGVLKMLLGLSIKKSTGPGVISPHVLKEAALEFCPILTYIFNRSLSSNEVLPRTYNDWRLANNIFALHKKGAATSTENYRPISLTSVVT